MPFRVTPMIRERARINFNTKPAASLFPNPFLEGRCPFCNEVPNEFRNKVSFDEYQINGLCQSCIDETFKLMEQEQ